MILEMKVPSPGESITEVEIAEWLVEDGDYQTFMPWTMYSEMEEGDLRAMFTYLQSLEPVDNKIVKFTSVLD